MVLPLLAFVRLPSGNQPEDAASPCIGDRKKPPLNLAEGEPAFLAVVAAGILTVQPVRVEKNPYRVVERYAVFSDILRGLAAVPFK